MTQDPAPDSRAKFAQPRSRMVRPLASLGITALAVGVLMTPGQAASALPLPAEENTDIQDNKLLLLMDASGSMNETDSGGNVRIEAAREALHSVVDELDDDLDVGLRVFSSEITDPDDPAACQDSSLVQEIGSGNRDGLRDAIDEYDAIGARTPISYALEQAVEDLGNEGNRTIVLVSDGEENCVPDPCVATEAIAESGIDLAIHTVGYNVNSTAREQLQCIADEFNGDYYDAEDVEDLTWTLQRLSLRAFQPFMIQGEEVAGSTDIATAPVLESGQYIDQWNEEPLYYRIPRTMEGSSIHVGVAAIHNEEADPAPLTIALGTEDTESWDTHERGIYLTNRELCAQNNLYEGVNEAALRVRSGQVTTFPDPEREDCSYTEELILQVEASDARGDNSYVDQPFEFIVVEEPPVTNLEELPEMATDSITEYQWGPLEVQADNAQELLGGNSFNNAAELEPGNTYTSEIYPGETMIYRVPVEWGEQLQVQLETPPREEWSSHRQGSAEHGLRLQLYSPYRGLVDTTRQAEGQEHDRYGLTEFDDTATWQNIAYPVLWNNRQATRGGHSDMTYASVAGYYYVLVSQMSHRTDEPVIVPLNLVADTFGDVEGVPEYDEDTTDEEITAPDPAEGNDEAITDESGGFGPQQWAITAMVVVGTALLAGGAFFLLRFLRRSN